MTSAPSLSPDNITNAILGRLRLNVDALSIGVAAVGSVMQGSPINAAQWPIALSLWSPAMRRFEINYGQTDSLAQLGPNIERVLQHVLQRAQFADDLLRVRHVDATTSDDGSIIMRDAIQRLASACFIGRNVIGLVAQRIPTTGARYHDQMIDRLLRAVSAGQAPCLDPSGALVIPGWAERRHHVRAITNERIELRWNNNSYVTSVINRTAHGLGIMCVGGLRPDMVIEVVMQDGFVSNARVAWVANSKAGLMLIGGYHHAMSGEHTVQQR